MDGNIGGCEFIENSNATSTGIKITEREIIIALANLEDIRDYVKNYLLYLGLISIDGDIIQLNKSGELVLSLGSTRYGVNSIMEKSEEFVDITLETPIEKLVIFPDDNKSNNSTILELQQYYKIYTLGDLMNSKLRGFSLLKKKETTKVFMDFLGELEKLGFIKK